MNKLIIIGAGDFGREVLAWALDVQAAGAEWQVEGFLDDNPAALRGYAVDFPVLGKLEDYSFSANDCFVCAIGQPQIRARVWQQVQARGGHFVNLIHPTALVGPRVQLGQGVIICPRVVLTCDLEIGDNTAINIASSVAHGARIGRHCQLSCFNDITGHVEIGDGAFLASRVTVIPGRKVGNNAQVAAGSVVAHDVPPNTTVHGNPARVIIKHT